MKQDTVKLNAKWQNILLSKSVYFKEIFLLTFLNGQLRPQQSSGKEKLPSEPYMVSIFTSYGIQFVLDRKFVTKWKVCPSHSLSELMSGN